ncbi:polysaccharide deacetylase family protein [Paenibacillus arenilitoris]|uniref:Polysaccharide deacetylase family protein n=1 Tax=Paenibacillus arenilitoris TaxID=2772299 RepID=A0A927CM62_9BACL|nr:polysaccharide deacetylase family protein [Paenibacillus arenilitoris]MBD2869772.1 polysaccharide deacetylase family protein [Paenibacillus arenilitoris]
MSLAEALGYGEKDRLLIVNADDYGLCHSVNAGIQQLLLEGAVSSATIMMPCGWAREAALWSAQNPQVDVGVHFTFTSEWDNYRWGPVHRHGSTASLVAPDGYFPNGCADFEQQADPAQVREELVAQIEMALAAGMNPSHADNHMGSLYGLATGRNFLPVVLDVCASYGLPFRLPRYLPDEDGQVAPPELSEKAKQLAQLADSMGVVILDYLVGLPFGLQDGETYDSFKGSMKQLLAGLRPGVTELIIHPSLVTEELRAFHGQPLKRGMEFDLFRDDEIKQTVKQEGIRLIRWSELQKLQRGRAGYSK